MVISYFGAHFLKVQQGDTTIAVNPFGKDTMAKPPRFGANIAIVSSDRSDMNAVESMSFGEREPVVIDGPGEYEVGGIEIVGVPSPSREVNPGPRNTVFVFSVEGIRLAILGALERIDLPGEALEALGEADVVVVPVGSEETITAAEAEKISVKLGAKVVIPVGFRELSDRSLKDFLKEAGSEHVDPVERFTFKKKDLEGKEGDIVLLVPGR